MLGVGPAFADGLPEGGRRAGARLRPVLDPHGRRGRARRCRWRASSGSTTSSARSVLLNLGSGGTDVCTGHRPGLPAPAGVRGRDRRPLPRRSTSHAFDPTGNAGRRRAGRAGDPPADAVDAGRASGTTRTARATAPPTSTYFPGVWRHGDWIMFTERGSSMITGPLRRDAEPRRRPAGDERVLRRRRGARRGARQPRRPPGGRPDELLLFVVLRDGRRARRRAAGADRRRAPDRALAAPRAGRDRRRAGDPAHAHRQEARAAGQADPHRAAPATRSSAADALADPASIEPFVAFARGRAHPAADG